MLTTIKQYLLGATAILSLLMFSSCAHPLRTSKWENKESVLHSVDKILVVCIDDDTSMSKRKFLEGLFVEDLKGIGANAVSSLNEFGHRGLISLEQEETYVKLCNYGIDAVLTIALLDNNSLSKIYKDKKSNTNTLYYKRIWSYKSLLNDTAYTNNRQQNLPVLFEAILFDLSTLSSFYWTQSKSFSPALLEQYSRSFSAVVSNDLKKMKIINQVKLRDTLPRTF